MIELTAIDIGKTRRLLGLRFVAAAFLALAMSLGLPLGAAAWELEIVVDGNTTIFRCTSAADFDVQTNDCSDNQAAWDCNGEVIAVQRDELGGCITRVATVGETLALITQQEQLVDILLANLDFQETPGGGPQNALEGLLNPNAFQSTESIQTQANPSTPVGPPPITPPPGPPGPP